MCVDGVVFEEAFFDPSCEGVGVSSKEFGGFVLGDAWVGDEDGFVEVGDVVTCEVEEVWQVLFRCVVGYAGVSDLIDAMIRSAQHEARITQRPGKDRRVCAHKTACRLEA